MITTLDGVTVAIIIPIYATAQRDVEWLEKCLSSCVGQAHEIIVWNDGSTASLDGIKAKFPTIALHNYKHIGKSFARNRAVESSRSELVYPVDADDWIAKNAIRILARAWRGVPTYSELYKVYGTAEEVYPLLSFDCEVMQGKSIASVNVLHSKEQWKVIGGWDEKFNLYEDWDYNVRLFWNFCGAKIQVPLVYYRQHDAQSTHVASGFDERYARGVVSDSIKRYVRGHLMTGCCGKRRNSPTRGGNPTVQHAPQRAISRSNVAALDLSVEANLNDMGDPGPGKVWARYIGGRGMGPHDRRGSGSRKKYQRVQYGGIYAVMASDAITEDAFSSGAPNCGFVAIRQKYIAPPPTPVVEEISVQEQDAQVAVSRSPAVAVIREPVVDGQVEEYVAQLASKSIKEIKELLDVANLEADDIATLLEAEKSSDTRRVGAVKLLQKALAKAV